MVAFSVIKDLLTTRGRIVGYLFDGTKESNKYVKLFVLLSNLNLAIAIAELVAFCYVVKDDLMKLLLQGESPSISSSPISKLIFIFKLLFFQSANHSDRCNGHIRWIYIIQV